MVTATVEIFKGKPTLTTSTQKGHTVRLATLAQHTNVSKSSNRVESDHEMTPQTDHSSPCEPLQAWLLPLKLEPLTSIAGATFAKSVTPESEFVVAPAACGSPSPEDCQESVSSHEPIRGETRRHNDHRQRTLFLEHPAIVRRKHPLGHLPPRESVSKIDRAPTTRH